MKRRHFLKSAGVATGAAVVGTSTAQAQPKTVHEWKMVTTWPKNFPGLGTGANLLAQKINEMTGGEVQVTVYSAGELVGALEVFDAVSAGKAEMGHGAAYFWAKKGPAFPFFTTVPFGMTANEHNAWLFYGGGLELWRELYDEYNLVPMPVASTGAQMGGWFNKEINSINDLRGLKMRIPGLGGQVMKRLGAEPAGVAPGKIFAALQTGEIDAAEFVGPYNDLAFGFYKAAKYYYYPGWQEGTASIECIISKDALTALPQRLRGLVLDAARIVNDDVLAEFNARNAAALVELVNQHDVVLRKYPDEVLIQLNKVTNEVLAEYADADAFSRKVFRSYTTFKDALIEYSKVSEEAFLNARSLLSRQLENESES